MSQALSIGWIMLWKQSWPLSRRLVQRVDTGSSSVLKTLQCPVGSHWCPSGQRPSSFYLQQNCEAGNFGLGMPFITTLSLRFSLLTILLKLHYHKNLHLRPFHQCFILLEVHGLCLCSSPNLGSFYHLSHYYPSLFCNIPLLLGLISHIFLSPEIATRTKEWEWERCFASPWMVHYLIFFPLHSLNELHKIYGN